MTENRAHYLIGFEDKVALDKTKRKFFSLKDMESEDANQFVICEFKVYANFEIFANKSNKNKWSYLILVIIYQDYSQSVWFNMTRNTLRL